MLKYYLDIWKLTILLYCYNYVALKIKFKKSYLDTQLYRKYLLIKPMGLIKALPFQITLYLST